MRVATHLFGEIEISPESVIRFPSGLVSFEHLKEFALLHDASKEQPSSYTLQSIADPAVAFQIMDPTALDFHYELLLSDEENAVLGTPASADTVVAVGFEFTDSAERYTYIVRRGASEVVPQLREDADIVVRVPAQVFKEMLAQLRNPAVTIAKDFEVVKGGKLGFVRFMRLFVPVEE